MTRHLQTTECRFEGFEQLREVVPGTRREIVQVESGALSGSMLHATIGDLPIDVVTFNLGVRSRGEYPQGRVTLGMLLVSDGDAASSRYAVPGDVMMTPPGLDGENTYRGTTSIFVTSLPLREIEDMYGGEAALESLDFRRRIPVRGEKRMADLAASRLTLLSERLKQIDRDLTAEAAAFWRRGVVDAMMTNVLYHGPAGFDEFLPSAAKLVASVDEFVAAQRDRAVHISEICRAVRVSRRTLHRAFQEVLGMGPIAYLRYRRLCAIHTILCSGSRGDWTIQNLALEFGFLNPGRLAQYFRGHFGRFPAEIRGGPARRL